MDLTPQDEMIVNQRMKEIFGLPYIQAMRRRLLETQIGVLEQYLKPFDEANYIDCEIVWIRDIVEKMKDW